ncbi:MAG: hypothetical protein K6A44_06505 [bacterium]|nr:hypothetical protein [bacterium]
MKKIGFLLGILAVTSLTCAWAAEQTPVQQPQQLQVQYDARFKPSGSTVLKGAISQVQELPVGMYGMWQVRGNLQETTNFEKYTRRSSDIWILRKDGEFVTLINPQNGANATITITEVVDNTATFTRGVSSCNMREAETVTITLMPDGNSFSGTDIIMSQEVVNGITMSDVAKYRVSGVKISGQTIYRPKNAVTTGR